MALKVCKFGGTSMADGNVMTRVRGIILSDPERRYIVVSAPGKRYGDDIKVTDILYACFDAVQREGRCRSEFSRIRSRFTGIVRELGIDFDIETLLDETEAEIDGECSVDFTASRGEYLCARIMASLLGAEFVDAKDVIFFNDAGRLDTEKTYRTLSERVDGLGLVVIPGFYGTGADGRIRTFSRGGSDISGAVVAGAVNASLYENWTDVSGFYACDPKIVNSPKGISVMSYKELRELSYMGANVLHSDSIFPVRRANIPIQIKNTFRPEDAGTSIVPTSHFTPTGNIVTGIAGHRNFTVIYIEKSHMNAEIGFVRKVLTVLEKFGISIEHIPSGIDTMSVVMESSQVSGYRLREVLDGISEEVHPDFLRVTDNVALVATVGHGMSSSVGTSARLFKALAEAGINIKMIDQGSSEMNIIVGVGNDDCERCIAAIYHEFF
ncbi:MAG: aspartate kinase [Clostridia bacterium]|nr:aspartate kinase [Clostridia bacterium]